MLNYRTTRSQLQRDKKAPTRPPVTAHLAATKNKPIVQEIQVITSRSHVFCKSVNLQIEFNVGD